MDRSSESIEEKEEEEEDKEVFETAEETITSTSPQTESSGADEEEGNSNTLSQSWYSNPDIWRRKPGSIHERRQQLLACMESSSNSHIIDMPTVQLSPRLAPLIEPFYLAPASQSSLFDAISVASFNPDSTEPATMQVTPGRTYFSSENQTIEDSTESQRSEATSPFLQYSTSSIASDRLAYDRKTSTILPFHSLNHSSVKGKSSQKFWAYLNRGRLESETTQSSRETSETSDGEVKRLERDENHRAQDNSKELTLEQFKSPLGISPIVQEVLRRVKVGECTGEKNGRLEPPKESGWMRMFRGVMTKGSSKRFCQPKKELLPQAMSCVKVHTHQKPVKEFTELRIRQELIAHEGAIWTMKFSPDGFYLASAGQDCVVRVWEVVEQNKRDIYLLDAMGDFDLSSRKAAKCGTMADPQPHSYSRFKVFSSRKKHQHSILCPSNMFLLSSKPRCSFVGHQEDILDLSWSKSQFILSSSMDKTVRLWHISTKECLKIFTHNDYVTCIQFNPMDDRYFISGSLDGKARIWSITDHQVVDWVDLHEMVTATSYTPDGKGAVVGSYKGTCRLYKQSGDKLRIHKHINVKSKGKKSFGKKITGFQFVCGDPEKILITSSDSRVRLYDGITINREFKGFQNTKSQIYAASVTDNGSHIICASEDSRVCIWTTSSTSSPSGNSGHGKESCSSYEDFQVRNVLVALPWPCGKPYSVKLTSEEKEDSNSGVSSSQLESTINLTAADVDIRVSGEIRVSDVLENPGLNSEEASLYFTSLSEYKPAGGLKLKGVSTTNASQSMVADCSFFGDNKGSATWPEESLQSGMGVLDARIKMTAGLLESDQNIRRDLNPAWGLAIVTGGLSGEIRLFQNFGLPI